MGNISNKISEKTYVVKTSDNFYLKLSEKDYELIFKEKSSLMIINKNISNENENEKIITQIIFTKIDFENFVLYKRGLINKEKYLDLIKNNNINESLEVIHTLKNIGEITNEEASHLFIREIFKKKITESCEAFIEFYKKKDKIPDLKWLSSALSSCEKRNPMDNVSLILQMFDRSFYGHCILKGWSVLEIIVLEKFIILLNEKYVGVVKNNLKEWLEYHEENKLFLEISGKIFFSNDRKTIYIFNSDEGTVTSYDKNFKLLNISDPKHNMSSLLHFEKNNKLIIFSFSSETKTTRSLKKITYYDFDLNYLSLISYELKNEYIINKNSVIEDIDLKSNKITIKSIYDGEKHLLEFIIKDLNEYKFLEEGEINILSAKEKTTENSILKDATLLGVMTPLNSYAVCEKIVCKKSFININNGIRKLKIHTNELRQYMFEKSNFGMQKIGDYYYFTYKIGENSHYVSNLNCGKKIKEMLNLNGKISLYDAIDLLYYHSSATYLSVERNIEKIVKILNKYE